MKILLAVLTLCFAASAFAGDGPFPAPSDTAATGTGEVSFSAPKFGVNSDLGIGYGISMSGSYNGIRSTGGLKVRVFETTVGNFTGGVALEGLYSDREGWGGRAILGAGYKDLVYVYAAPGNFWDSGVDVKLQGTLGAYASYGGWDKTVGLRYKHQTRFVKIGYSQAFGFVLGVGYAFNIN